MKRVTLSRPTRGAGVVAYVAPKNNKKNAQSKEAPISPSKGGINIGGFLPMAGTEVEKKEATDLDSLLKLADQLKPADRKQLLARLALADGNANVGSERDIDMWAQAIYAGLVAAIGHQDGAGQAPMVIKRTMAARSAWGPVADFMASSKLDTLKVVERQAVYGMLAKLVIEKAAYVSQKSGAPLSAKLVSNLTPNIAAIFDGAFPGYLQSGLVRVIAKRLTSGYTPPDGQKYF